MHLLDLTFICSLVGCWETFSFELISFVLHMKVPELFYLPEILTNENAIDFGTTQLGGKLGMYFKVNLFSSC